jgi:uncharacterized membrane protein
MNTFKELTRVNIGIPDINIAPHWAYYIGGAIFIILAIVSMYYTYYFITHPSSEESINESKGFKKQWLKNRVTFTFMFDVICVLVTVFFMINGS